MRSRTSLDTSSDDASTEERLEAELEDCQEMVTRYDRKLSRLQEENERLRDTIDELETEDAASRRRPSDTDTIVLTPDKRTTRTVRFREQTGSGQRDVLGTIYVKKWWLDDRGWAKEKPLVVEIRVGLTG